jgi:tRNA 2-thiouridine synthesizing protein B
MAMLHTVNKSPFESGTLESCLRLAQPGSAVLLIEDGVYAALAGTRAAEQVRAAMGRLKFYALGPDLKARGMEPERLIEGIGIVDYGGFVDLAAEHRAVQAWL